MVHSLEANGHVTTATNSGKVGQRHIGEEVEYPRWTPA